MITILRGTSENLIHYVTREYTTPHDFVIVGSKDFALPFVIVRLIIPMLRKQLGKEHVDDMLGAYKIHFGLIFDKLTEKLSAAERQEQDLLAARLASNITHSRVAKDAILRTYAMALLEMKAKHDFRLVIPDMTHMDTGSLDLLLYLYQVFPDRSPDLVLGYDPVWEKPLQEKDTGISWYYALDSDTVLRAFVYAFESVAVDQKDVSDQRPLDAAWGKLEDRLDMLDDCVELKVYRSTELSAQPPDDERKDFILKGIQRCFRLYDFTNALFLSMRSLAVLEPLTGGRELAALYHIIALSAHNRHFFSQGNVALADFINHALQKALLYETDPATRVAILYRLIVTLGRRKNEQDMAHAYLGEAYRILSEKTFEHHEVLTAWINNIHSFLLMKEGKIKEAIATHEVGFYLLDHLHKPEQKALQIEIEFTKAVLAENLSTLNSLSGNFKQMKRWYTIESQLARQWPSLHAVPSAEWQSFHYQNLELGKALEKTEQGLVKARNSFHYVLEYYFTVSAADIHYRLGNAAEALLYFRKALVFQGQVGYAYASLHALYICLVKTEIRLNRIEEALEDIATMNTVLGAGTEREQIEIYLVTAYCHSCSGAAESAEEAINAAIDLAVAGGDCGTLVKVMLWTGKVCLQLNRKQDAIAAYHQALEMAQTVLDGVIYEPDTADLAEIYFGLYVCSRKKVAYLEQAIYNLSLSLKKDADSWWTLPQIIAALSLLPAWQKNNYLKEHKATINNIRKAAKQRKDCQASLSALKPNPIKQLTT